MLNQSLRSVFCFIPKYNRKYKSSYLSIFKNLTAHEEHKQTFQKREIIQNG